MNPIFQLFSRTAHPKTSKALYLVAPIILAAGVLFTAQPILGFAFALTLSIVILTILYILFGKVPRHTYQNLQHPDPDIDFVETPKTILSTNSFTSPDPEETIQITFYQGVGEWISAGRIPLSDFIEAIREADSHIAKISYSTLVDAVKYQYAVTSYSTRLEKQALKIVNKEHPGAFPITRLKAPYDFVNTQKTTSN